MSKPYDSSTGISRGPLTRARTRAAQLEKAHKKTGITIASNPAHPVPPPPPRTTFENIPLDLHLCIADHLDSFTDLASLSVVSRKFYHHFQDAFWKCLSETEFEERRGRYISAAEWAAQMGYPNTLRRLLDIAGEEAFKMPPKREDGKVCGRTMLERAVESGNDRCVVLIIARSRDFDIPDEYFTWRGAFYLAKSHKIFSLLAEEASSRLAMRGFR